MELRNSFTVAVPVERAWAVLTDLERVAPCLPGAALLGVDGDDYRGAVKVKVGPVTARYEGVARFAQRDDDRHHAVLRAEGRDARGQGNAAATIDLQLTPRGAGTEVVVVTDLELAGRVAQFGRGVIADVSGKLIGRFAQQLEEEMGREECGPFTTSGPDAAPADRVEARRASVDEVEPLDLMATGGGPMLGVIRAQAVPLAVGALALLAGWLLGRSTGRTRRPSPRGAAAAPVVLQLVLPTLTPANTTVHDVQGDR
ncbi:SRPBCC family protein [Pseudonocardia adelaidensis]|uniref:Carbon monoxide dehydrogenase subunit G n=1 Tax=Pseudonocardia adelaidensis TaxID=648754 RepID=A0ABP9NCN5_9PSEU